MLLSIVNMVKYIMYIEGKREIQYIVYIFCLAMDCNRPMMMMNHIFQYLLNLFFTIFRVSEMFLRYLFVEFSHFIYLTVGNFSTKPIKLSRKIRKFASVSSEGVST